MAQQSSHRSQFFPNHLIWFSIFAVIFGMVQSCEVWEHRYRFDKVTSSLPREFLVGLKKEMDTTGTGSDIKIIEILASRNKSELTRIAECYNDCYHRDLIADLKDKLNGKLEQIAVALLTPEMKYNVKLIHDAMVGVESDSCALIDILCTADKKILDQIQAEYQKMYRTRLITDLDKHTVGNFKKLLGGLLRWSRKRNTAVDKKLAKTDAQKLNSVRDIFSNDRSLMDSILVTGSFSRIRQAVFRYYADYKEYFESKINKKYCGDVRRALIAIVRWSKGRESFLAERIHDNLNSVDNDGHSLIRIIVSNLNDMSSIKKAYKKRYHQSLDSAIRDKLSGSYADAIIFLITRGKDQVDSIEEDIPDDTVEETVEETVDETVDEYSEENPSKEDNRFNWCYWC